MSCGVTLVQAATGNWFTDGGSPSTFTVAYSVANTAGHCLIVDVGVSVGGGTRPPDPVLGITDSLGNTWTPIDLVASTAADAGNLWNYAQSWFCFNCKSGANSVTVTGSEEWATLGLTVREYSGLVIDAPVRGVNYDFATFHGDGVFPSASTIRANIDTTVPYGVAALCYYTSGSPNTPGINSPTGGTIGGPIDPPLNSDSWTISLPIYQADVALVNISVYQDYYRGGGSYHVALQSDAEINHPAAIWNLLILKSAGLTPPAFSCAASSLADGEVGVSYSQNLGATGGTPPLDITVTSGALPTGLTLNSATGQITGTPTTEGAYTFAIQITDAAGCLVTTSGCSIRINPQFTCGTLIDGAVGTPYSEALFVSGGTAPYTFEIVHGALPDGLSLDFDTGAITGTPTVAGDFPFIAAVNDAAFFSSFVTCDIFIAGGGVTLSCASPPSGTVGTPYDHFLLGSGGTPPYLFDVISGALPDGLSLSEPTGEITGTPTMAGTFNFTCQITDSASGAGKADCSIVIGSGETVVVNCASPPAGAIGVAYSHNVTASGGTPPYTFSLIGGALPVGLSLASSGAITGIPSVGGTFSFTIQAEDSVGGVGSSVCTINITGGLSLACNTCETTGYVDTGYECTLLGTGGSPPYTYSLISGSLPGGYTLNASTGVISGTATAGSTTTFVAKVVDSGTSTATATATCGLNVRFSVDCSGLPHGTVGVPYAGSITTDVPQTCPTNGGADSVPQQCWVPWTNFPDSPNLDAPALGPDCPCALYYSVIGFVGTGLGPVPGATILPGIGDSIVVVMPALQYAGTYTVHTDFAGPVFTNFDGSSGTPIGTTTTSINQVLGTCPIVIEPAIHCPPSATQGQAYTGSLTESGGIGAVTYHIASGTLPSGLTLNTVTGAITGTATAIGSSVFVITGTDTATNTGTVTCTMFVLPPSTGGGGGGGGGFVPQPCLSSLGLFKHWRTWYNFTDEPTRQPFFESALYPFPSETYLKTWLPDINPLGGTTTGVLYIDAMAVSTQTMTGSVRRVWEWGLPNVTVGKMCHSEFTSTVPFKYWQRGAQEWEFEPKPYNKTTWLVTYKKVGGASQLDMGRFYALDVEGPLGCVFTNTWLIDGAPFSTNTFLLSRVNLGESQNAVENDLIDGAPAVARMYEDLIAFPPGARGYLFQQQLTSTVPFKVWRSNIDIDRITVKGLSRVTVEGTPQQSEPSRGVIV